jgi:precorrin-6B methylase 1
MPKGNLTVVGSGIAAVRHATQEACFHIAHADKVFFLVVDPLTRAWIQSLNPAAESLSVHLVPGKDRRESFEDMVKQISEAVHEGHRVCAVFYGHPGIFVQPSYLAMRRLQAEGYDAVMLPGISSEDCLVADLAVDLSQCGYQCHEASNFLVGNKHPDTAAALVLWQIGVIGQIKCGVGREDGLRILAERLLTFYSPEHEVTVYEAASLPVCDPVIRKTALSDLAKCAVGPASTLFVPPAHTPPLDADMLARLQLDVS